MLPSKLQGIRNWVLLQNMLNHTTQRIIYFISFIGSIYNNNSDSDGNSITDFDSDFDDE